MSDEDLEKAAIAATDDLFQSEPFKSELARLRAKWDADEKKVRKPAAPERWWSDEEKRDMMYPADRDGNFPEEDESDED